KSLILRFCSCECVVVHMLGFSVLCQNFKAVLASAFAKNDNKKVTAATSRVLQ
ncbi:hypothetical protein ACJX0J_009244, partial [Zea mays]